MNDDLVARLRALILAATPITDEMVHRYEHGGGRVMRFSPSRDLVADLYDEANRECWVACRIEMPRALDKIERLRARVAELEAALTARDEALTSIALQNLPNEVTDHDPDDLDWVGGYEGCVKAARAALKARGGAS